MAPDLPYATIVLPSYQLCVDLLEKQDKLAQHEVSSVSVDVECSGCKCQYVIALFTVYSNVCNTTSSLGWLVAV